jgi:hypothetical protein
VDVGTAVAEAGPGPGTSTTTDEPAAEDGAKATCGTVRVVAMVFVVKEDGMVCPIADPVEKVHGKVTTWLTLIVVRLTAGGVTGGGVVGAF